MPVPGEKRGNIRFLRSLCNDSSEEERFFRRNNDRTGDLPPFAASPGKVVLLKHAPPQGRDIAPARNIAG
ncbi:hypothetical protein C5Q97_15400 [Victivallales bacterium CCUG 44730]|nr:hypothetical protein C5Q97_15400 [Victivallales bacterium CCUG 44730]